MVMHVFFLSCNLNLWHAHVPVATAAEIKKCSVASKVGVSCSPISVSSKMWKAERSPFSSMIGFHPFNTCWHQCCCLCACPWGEAQWMHRWSLPMGMQYAIVLACFFLSTAFWPRQVQWYRLQFWPVSTCAMVRNVQVQTFVYRAGRRYKGTGDHVWEKSVAGRRLFEQQGGR